MPKCKDIYRYVIGVDPGWGCTGVACLLWDDRLDDWRVDWAQGYKGDVGSTNEERMSILIGHIKNHLINTVGWGKDILFGIEENHITGGRSAQTALKQRELIGVLKYEAHQCNYQVMPVAASSAKKALVGSGNASKEDMVDWASAVPGFPKGGPKYAAEAMSDAVAVALAAVIKAEKELM